MKNKFLWIALIFSGVVFSSKAQDFKETLKNTFDTFDSTQDFTQKQNLSNKLTLVAKKYNSEWSAHYYAAYSKMLLSYMEPDTKKKDAYIDEADVYIADAEKLLGKETDELFVLKAMNANARLAVDGQNRWMKYGKIFESNLEKAKELNANNPRIYYLKGTSVFFTPKMFGGGKDKAKEYFSKAQPLFDAESSDDITKPYWGKEANKYFLEECDKKD